MAKAYGIPVILHTDHAAKNFYLWIDGLLDAGKNIFLTNREDLYLLLICLI